VLAYSVPAAILEAFFAYTDSVYEDDGPASAATTIISAVDCALFAIDDACLWWLVATQSPNACILVGLTSVLLAVIDLVNLGFVLSQRPSLGALIILFYVFLQCTTIYIMYKLRKKMLNREGRGDDDGILVGTTAYAVPASHVNTPLASAQYVPPVDSTTAGPSGPIVIKSVNNV
jgi:hypothetical protein